MTPSPTLDLQKLRLGRGKHPPTANPGDRNMCLMEAVAFVAGEPWSDQPKCADATASILLTAINDTLSDEERDRELPARVWVPLLVGSSDAVGVNSSHLLVSVYRNIARVWLDRLGLSRWSPVTGTVEEVRDATIAVRAINAYIRDTLEGTPVHAALVYERGQDWLARVAYNLRHRSGCEAALGRWTDSRWEELLMALSVGVVLSSAGKESTVEEVDRRVARATLEARDELLREMAVWLRGVQSRRPNP